MRTRSHIFPHVDKKAQAPRLLKLPTSCLPHLPLHQSLLTTTPPPFQKSAAAAHPLSAIAFSSLFISGAWWFSFLAHTFGYSFIRISAIFYLGTSGRRIYVYSTFSYSPLSPWAFKWFITSLFTIHVPQYLFSKGKLIPYNNHGISGWWRIWQIVWDFKG